MEKLGRFVAGVLFVAAVAVTSFYAGYSLPRAGVAAASAPAPVSPTATPGSREYFDVFWEAWNLVQDEFYNRQAVDPERLTYGAIKGMLEALDDPHTSFSTPDQTRVSEEDMRGSFFGVGIQVEERDGKLVVVAPIDDTPAQRAGIRAGDIIAGVDGQPLTGTTLREAVTLIRGPRGSKVRLSIERAGAGQPLEFELVRSEIRMSIVKTEMLEGQIGYVKLNMFSANAGADVKRALQELMKEKPVGIVFDLRNNPGGLLHSSVDVASQFLESGVVLIEEHRDGKVDTFHVKPGGVATNVPLVVLVNKGSASASEIVAGALQDHQRAVLIGEPTFGKSTVQNVHKLSDQSSVRITFAQWWTPKRQELNHKGLHPDIVVTVTEADRAATRDPQLQAAVAHLRQAAASSTVIGN